MPAGRGRNDERVFLFLVVLLVSQLALPQPAAAASPTTSFDWSVPPRTIDLNGDGFIDAYNDCGGPIANKGCPVAPSLIKPTVWPVQINACASTPATGGTITKFDFAIRPPTGSPVATASQPGCTATLGVPTLGSWIVDVTAWDGTDSNTATQTIVVKDILFASLGDSYAAGEGNPPFEDTRCHRSTRAASAQTALMLEADDPKTSVTFIHLACSGALIMDHNKSDAVADGGMIDPYEGAVPRDDDGNGANDALPPQVDELKRLVGTRKIDILDMSIGGNDMGFANIIKSCIDPSFVTSYLLWLLTPPCSWDVPGAGSILTGFEPGVRIFNRGIGDLPWRYRFLEGALLATFSYDSDELDTNGNPLPVLAPNRVYLNEAPDPTTHDTGVHCGWPLLLTDLPGFTQVEFFWAGTTVAPALNSVMRSATTATGWNYVGGISTKFFGHGYCAFNHWIIGLNESITGQGDQLGTMHPNLMGQNAIRDSLHARLAADLKNPPSPPAMKLIPAFSILLLNWFDTAGANGWFTGECVITFLGAMQCDRSTVHFDIRITDAQGIGAPLPSSLTLSIDGQPVAIALSGTTLTCTPANAADACDVFPSGGTNPTTVDVLLKLGGQGTRALVASATDRLGNVSTESFQVKIDRTLPTLANAQITSGTAGTNGWYTSSVGLQFSASDAVPGSGLNRLETLRDGAGPNGEDLVLATTGDPLAGPITSLVSTEGANTIGYEAVDNAELRSGRKTIQVNVDTQAPTISGAPDRPADSRGWYNGDVTVHFTAADAVPGSGIASVTSDVVLGEGAAQTVAGTTADVAGHTASTSVGPLSVDETRPTESLTGASDGTFTFSAADLLSGTVFTNATTLAVGYTAGDALSGLYSVRLGGSSSTAGSGTLTLALASGIGTYTLVAEDVAGNTREISFDVLSIQPNTSGGAVIVDPRGAGFWRGAANSGAYTQAAFDQLIAQASFASRAFGATYGLYPDATAANADELLSPATPANNVRLALRRHLLAAWLNLVSGREPAAQAVDISKVKGWQAVFSSSNSTALALMRETESKLAGPLTQSQLDAIKDMLEDLSSGKLNN
jgi:hypothetical protein